MQQAQVELPNADGLKPLFAVDVFPQYLNVRIRTPKAGDGVWDYADGGHAHRAKHNASGLASARTPSGVHGVGRCSKSAAIWGYTDRGANVVQRRLRESADEVRNR